MACRVDAARGLANLHVDRKKPPFLPPQRPLLECNHRPCNALGSVVTSKGRARQDFGREGRIPVQDDLRTDAETWVVRMVFGQSGEVAHGIALASFVGFRLQQVDWGF